ncbi:MAG: DUF397 domain-containing protein [Trebonia sp.]
MTPMDDYTRNEWRKSSYSNNGGNCVETAVLGRDQAPAARKADAGRLLAMRDSQDPAGPRLYFTPAEWGAFARSMKDGAFDGLG